MKFVLFLFLVCCSSIKAQEKLLAGRSEVDSLSNDMTTLFSQNNPLEAFNLMEYYWPLPETELDLIKEKTIKALNLLEDRFGKPIGITKVRSTDLADIFIEDVYFIRYNVTVLRFVYRYYKTDLGWIMNSFKFDEEYEEEFSKN